MSTSLSLLVTHVMVWENFLRLLKLCVLMEEESLPMVAKLVGVQM